MMEIYEELDHHIMQSQYDVRAVGYDPYNARDLIERWITDNSSYGVVKVPQGARTESVPLGELKILASDKKLEHDQALMTFCMGNSIALEDSNGNRKLYKARRQEKIDAVAATLDAFIAYKANRDEFV